MKFLVRNNLLGIYYNQGMHFLEIGWCGYIYLYIYRKKS
uniref:Uncharacterized protein n=1 Tax=Heterorhabditis bacteriophora TaxID=37862 RepID=A0A1I7X3K8_HETBA